MECLCPSVHPLVSPRRKVWITYIQAYMPHESSEDSSNQPDGPMGSHRCPPWPTEWRYQKFDRNRYRDFFSDTKFSETDTETFFPIPNFPKPKPIPSKNWQKFRNREVSKPKCQSLVKRWALTSSDKQQDTKNKQILLPHLEGSIWYLPLSILIND